MNWKKESESELRDFKKKQEALNNIPSIIEHINFELMLFNNSINNINNNNDYRWDDTVINSIIKRSELERNLLLIKHRVELVERGLSSITFDERRILELFYIDRPIDHLQKLSEELCYEKSSVYNKKDVAIRNFTLAMYGIN
ncbi:hypothetical protein AAFA46_08025 [Oscillospiraceae bacterium WX1]